MKNLKTLNIKHLDLGFIESLNYQIDERYDGFAAMIYVNNKVYNFIKQKGNEIMTINKNNDKMKLINFVLLLITTEILKNDESIEYLTSSELYEE